MAYIIKYPLRTMSVVAHGHMTYDGLSGLLGGMGTGCLVQTTVGVSGLMKSTLLFDNVYDTADDIVTCCHLGLFGEELGGCVRKAASWCQLVWVLLGLVQVYIKRRRLRTLIERATRWTTRDELRKVDHSLREFRKRLIVDLIVAACRLLSKGEINVLEASASLWSAFLRYKKLSWGQSAALPPPPTSRPQSPAWEEARERNEYVPRNYYHRFQPHQNVLVNGRELLPERLPVRAWQSGQARFVGPVRLPPNYFEAEANLDATSEPNATTWVNEELNPLSVANIRLLPDNNSDDGRRQPGKIPPVPVRQRITSFSSPTTLQPRSDLLEEIRAQIDLALHKGGYMRDHVASLFSKAHDTPEHIRTEAQRILLVEAELPPPGHFSGSNNRVYVDASEHGIGFIFSNQWQAWRLKPGWKNGMDEIQVPPIRLAEAIAIELGIRSMIEAGVRGEIVMRSDNLPVVEAILRRSTRSPRFGHIVEHILDICQQHGIHLKILWIPGEINPADGPSRFCVGSHAERFPYAVDTPPHLQDLVLPYPRYFHQ